VAVAAVVLPVFRSHSDDPAWDTIRSNLRVHYWRRVCKIGRAMEQQDHGGDRNPPAQNGVSSSARSAQFLSRGVCTMAVTSRIILQTHPFDRRCRLPSDNAPVPESAREGGYCIFAFEDEEKYYAEKGKYKSYEVDGEAIEDGDGGADGGSSCKARKVVDVIELVPDVVCS
jgi:hypothetical protein